MNTTGGLTATNVASITTSGFHTCALTTAGVGYWSLGPFNFLRGGRGGGPNLAGAAWRVSGNELIVPFWSVALVLAGVFALLIRLTRPRLTPGLCATCGYDLRASPDRCPACGAPA